MPETINLWFAPVLEHPVVQSIITRHFICGIITGIAVIYLLRLLLWICLRKKYCSSIPVSGEAGDITISGGAITSVIIHESAALKCLQIKRVRVYPVKDGYRIGIRAVLDPAAGTAPALMEQLAEIVKSRMSEIFGIDNVQKVSLEIVNCSSNTAEVENGNEPEKCLEPEDDSEFFHSAGHGDRTISLKFHGTTAGKAEKERE